MKKGNGSGNGRGWKPSRGRCQVRKGGCGKDFQRPGPRSTLCPDCVARRDTPPSDESAPMPMPDMTMIMAAQRMAMDAYCDLPLEYVTRMPPDDQALIMICIAARQMEHLRKQQRRPVKATLVTTPRVKSTGSGSGA